MNSPRAVDQEPPQCGNVPGGNAVHFFVSVLSVTFEAHFRGNVKERYGEEPSKASPKVENIL